MYYVKTYLDRSVTLRTSRSKRYVRSLCSAYLGFWMNECICWTSRHVYKAVCLLFLEKFQPELLAFNSRNLSTSNYKVLTTSYKLNSWLTFFLGLSLDSSNQARGTETWYSVPVVAHNEQVCVSFSNSNSKCCLRKNSVSCYKQTPM